MSNRWHSWSATAPLWVPAVVLVLIAAGLFYAALRSVRHGR